MAEDIPHELKGSEIPPQKETIVKLLNTAQAIAHTKGEYGQFPLRTGETIELSVYTEEVQGKKLRVPDEDGGTTEMYIRRQGKKSRWRRTDKEISVSVAVIDPENKGGPDEGEIYQSQGVSIHARQEGSKLNVLDVNPQDIRYEKDYPLSDQHYERFRRKQIDESPLEGRDTVYEHDLQTILTKLLQIDPDTATNLITDRPVSPEQEAANEFYRTMRKKIYELLALTPNNFPERTLHPRMLEEMFAKDDLERAIFSQALFGRSKIPDLQGGEMQIGDPMDPGI